MPYLVDGHNLIPKIPGINLSDLDDEQALIDLLLDFCRADRHKVEVFFDRAAPGNARTQTRAFLTTTFVQAGTTADEAIRRRLKNLGKDARNWKVVSSDRQVRAEAAVAHATVLSAEEFADLVMSTLESQGKTTSSPNRTMSETELQNWMELFKKRPK